MEISIISLPLIAAVISGFFGKFIGDRNSEILTSLLVSISAVFSAVILYEVIENQYENNIVIATWINSGSLNVNWSIKIDALSAVMLFVVTSVSRHVNSTLSQFHGLEGNGQMSASLLILGSGAAQGAGKDPDPVLGRRRV